MRWVRAFSSARVLPSLHAFHVHSTFSSPFKRLSRRCLKIWSTLLWIVIHRVLTWNYAPPRLHRHQTYLYTCRLTCILYLKFFVSVFSFLSFYFLSILTLGPRETSLSTEQTFGIPWLWWSFSEIWTFCILLWSDVQHVGSNESTGTLRNEPTKSYFAFKISSYSH